MIGKRLFDIAVSVVGLAVLLPLFAVVALCIKWETPGPAFFRQERVGRHGRPFRIHKFRTMRTDAESSGPQITIGADSRITRVGRFLREYKLDELPQLIDVVLGTMSLVGPRPEVPRYMSLYPEEVRAKVLSLRPGITDWAAIRFRDENALLEGAVDPEKVYVMKILPIKQELYLEYVDTRTFLGDLRVIAATLVMSFMPRSLR